VTSPSPVGSSFEEGRSMKSSVRRWPPWLGRVVLVCTQVVASCAPIDTSDGAGAAKPAAALTVAPTPDPVRDIRSPTQDAHLRGMWTSLAQWPLVAIHMSVLPNGHVLTYGSPRGAAGQNSLDFDEWNPAMGLTDAAHATSGNPTAINSFCGTAKLMPDGLLFVAGGNSTNTTAEWNPDRGLFMGRAMDLAYPRWYASLVRMADNRVLVVGGAQAYSQDAYGHPENNDPISFVPELFSADGGWSKLTGAASIAAFGAQDNRWWYPKAYLAPDGSAFGISHNVMWNLDPNGAGSLRLLGTLSTTGVGASASSVMFDSGRILLAGGGQRANGESGAPGSKQATIIDIRGPEPRVSPAADMSYARSWGTAAVLPDGHVLMTGGTQLANEGAPYAVYPAEMWDPSTNRWMPLASASAIRVYHSTAALLPSGAVLNAGGGVPGPVDNFNAQVFYPPYFFKQTNGQVVWADRPQIHSLSMAPAYGRAVDVMIRDERSIRSVALISLASVTHSHNNDQRRIPLAFTQAGRRLHVEIPYRAALAPPGHYQLHVVDADGVPSPGAIVELKPALADRAALELGTLRAFSAVNYPTYRIAHDGSLAPSGTYGVIAPLTPAAPDRSRFYVRAGLADSECYSFESRDSPGQYLRHAGFRLRVSSSALNSGAFAADATFCLRSGLSGTGISFESKNFPGFYIRHRHGELWLDARQDVPLYRLDASFRVVSEDLIELSSGVMRGLGSIHDPGYRVRHAWALGWVSPVDQGSSALDRHDSSWTVRPGLADASCLSFESKNYPGWFLRHSNFRIMLGSSDGSALFQADATFCPRAGLAGQGLTFESKNYPSRFIRQRGTDLWLDPIDGTERAQFDTSFSVLPALAN